MAPPDRYKLVGASASTPADDKRRKELFVPQTLTDYTLLYHYGDLDRTPVRGASFLATFVDGQTRQGQLDNNGSFKLCQVPKGPVSVQYQFDQPYEDDEQIIAARNALAQSLQAIVKQTKLDMAAEWQEWNQAGWIKREYLVAVNTVEGAAVGSWHWLKGTVECIWQLAVLLYKTTKEVAEITKTVMTADWPSLDKKIANYRAKGEKVLAAASEIKEFLILVFHDDKTRDLLKAFPGEWWAAMPPDEQAQLEVELGTQIILDVIIAALLAAFTAGSAGVAYGGAKWTERVGKLGAFKKLAQALRLRKRRVAEIDKAADFRKVIETKWVPPVAAAAVGEYALVNGKKVYPQKYSQLFHGTNKATLGVPETMPIEQVAAKIYKEGLPERGKNIDLVQHAKGAEDRAFRGTTQVLSTPDQQAGAILWADEGGLVVQVKDVKGYDVNALLEGQVKNADGSYGGNVVHGEQEIAVPGRIEPGHVDKVFKVVRNARGRLKAEEVPR